MENNYISESGVFSQKTQNFEHTDALSAHSQESYGECEVNEKNDYLHPNTSLQTGKKTRF